MQGPFFFNISPTVLTSQYLLQLQPSGVLRILAAALPTSIAHLVGVMLLSTSRLNQIPDVSPASNSRPPFSESSLHLPPSLSPTASLTSGNMVAIALPPAYDQNQKHGTSG
jgi:hypothetical protein